MEYLTNNLIIFFKFILNKNYSFFIINLIALIILIIIIFTISRKNSAFKVINKSKKQKALSAALKKTSRIFIENLTSILSKKNIIDNEIFKSIESTLYKSDIGVVTCEKLINKIRIKLSDKKIKNIDNIRNFLKEEIFIILSKCELEDNPHKIEIPHVILLVGVNGVGKTTSIGKLSKKFHDEGKRVVIGAGDTFRAAALDQLNFWSLKTNAKIVSSEKSKDPASVLFDAIKRAININYEIVLCDTAGRMHTKINLMNELKKIIKVLSKAFNGAPHEILLVIDATMGQNAIVQAREFSKIMNLNGIILTKLDGTAKGGIIISIVDELKIPIKYIGIGEGVDDLHKFNSKIFIDALFDD